MTRECRAPRGVARRVVADSLRRADETRSASAYRCRVTQRVPPGAWGRRPRVLGLAAAPPPLLLYFSIDDVARATRRRPAATLGRRGPAECFRRCVVHAGPATITEPWRARRASEAAARLDTAMDAKPYGVRQCDHARPCSHDLPFGPAQLLGSARAGGMVMLMVMVRTI